MHAVDVYLDRSPCAGVDGSVLVVFGAQHRGPSTYLPTYLGSLFTTNNKKYEDPLQLLPQIKF